MTEQLDEYDRVDNINALSVSLQRLLRFQQSQEFVLVLEGADTQRGASPKLLTALMRLPDDVRSPSETKAVHALTERSYQIPGLSVILISASTRAPYLQKEGVSHIHFPPYSRAEAIRLIATSAHALHPSVISLPSPELDQFSRWYAQFAAIVYDSLIAPTTTSVPVFRSTCEKLWPRFIWPYLSEERPPGQAKSWDFTRLLLRNRSLFQGEGEDVLVDRLQPLRAASTFMELSVAASATQETVQNGPGGSICMPPATTSKDLSTETATLTEQAQPPLLRSFAAILLVSAYLASHTPPKLDLLMFSRVSASSKSHKTRKSYHRRKLFQSHSRTAVVETTTTKTTKRLGPGLRSGGTRPFGLERLIAIVRAIHPQGVPNKLSVGDKVYRHLAELQRLRLVVPAMAGAGIGSMGGYDEDEKWRVNVSREWVEDLAAKWNFGFGEYEMHGA